MAQSRPRNRVTLYAAFTSGGEPVQNVFDFNRSKLETLLADRAANGTGFPGERIQRCTVDFYQRTLVKNGFPIPAGLEQGEPVPQTVPKFSISFSEDDVAHLLHALDVSIADIQDGAVGGKLLAEALLEVNQALRARLAALLAPQD